MKTVRVLLGAGALGLLALAAVWIGGLYRETTRLRAQALDAWGEADARQYLDQFLRDRADLVHAGLFPSRAGVRRSDAGPLLNGWLPWDGKDDATQAWNARAETGPVLGLAPEIRGELKRLGPSWPSYQPDLKRIDFSWLDQLRRHDHWDIAHHSPREGRTFGAVDAPLPDHGALFPWVKLRLLKGRAEGDVSGAVADLRHLADLIYSQGEPISAIVAANLLFVEAAFGQALPGPTPLVSPGLVEQAHRYFWAYPAFFDFRAPADLRARVLDGEGADLGLCMAVNRAMELNVFHRPFLRHAEAARFAALAKVVARAQKTCGDSWQLRAFADERHVPPELRMDDFFAADEIDMSHGGFKTRPVPSKVRISTEIFLRIPLLRERTGYIFVGIGGPDNWKRYKASQPSLPPG